MRIAFLGFGLIGGSIARALRADRGAPAWTMRRLVAVRRRARARPLADGVIDAAAGDAADALADADLVVLAAPGDRLPAAPRRRSPGRWRAALPPDAVVTDVASTKAAHRRAGPTPLGLRFVGRPPDGRPRGDRLRAPRRRPVRRSALGRRPRARTPDAARRRAGRRSSPTACRARPFGWTPPTHDRAVAGISHLPLAASRRRWSRRSPGRRRSDGRDWPAAAALAAGGWRDMTRLARGDPAMGAGIAATNAAGAGRAAARPAGGARRLAGRARAARRPGRGRRDPLRPPREPPRATPRRTRDVTRGARLRRPARRRSRTRPAGTGSGPTASTRSWPLVERDGRYEPRDRHGAGPVVQADHPVPRPARRRRATS